MNRTLLFFVIILFWVFVGDAIMSYVSPVLIENYLQSTFWMGIIIGSSSVFGLVCDFIFGKLFEHRSYAFFVKWMFVFTFLFPISFLFFPPLIFFFILAMAAWGIYYEFGRFSQYHFVHTFLKVNEHAQAWGLIESIRSATLVVATLLAPRLLDVNPSVALYGALAAFGMGLFLFFIFIRRHPVHQHPPTLGAPTPRPPGRTVWQEFGIWWTLARKVWPLLLLELALVSMDACIWSVGIVFNEELRDVSWWSGLVLPAYALAGVIMPLLASRASKPFGKKRAALITAVIGGCLFMIGGVFVPAKWFVVIMFVASMFHMITFPILYATFEDFMSRLSETDNEMVGLEGSVNSLAYVIGPILAGTVATFIGNQATFAVFGAALVLVGVVVALFTPRKIKLPQKELAAIVEGQTS